ncbi:MAG: 2-C-methyl-D-erythritol 4-phosphate cytidylyltransferase [bacterium]|nr:2-C-methyl-D-erythritol 4-phosphate cytidylyltransferase [bacterium]
MSVVALVLGAGQGTRLAQGMPKATVELAGRSVLEWSAGALGRARDVDAVLPVVPPGASGFEALSARWDGPAKLLPPTPGGASRQQSVACGLRAACSVSNFEWVLVHDAARCLVLPADAEAVLEAARSTGAALPVIPASDTVKLLDGERVERTLDRSTLGLAQTPQAFRVSILSEALAKAERDGFLATDCSSAVERLGVEVRTSMGRSGNWKLTHPEDLPRAEAVLLSRGQAE